jgi:transposase-like protein
MATAKKTTLPELMAQIAALQAEAEKVKGKEKADVIGRIKEAIEVYDILPGELFDGKKPKGALNKGATWRTKPVMGTKTRRPKRTFTEAERNRLVERHKELVESGLSFSQAAAKVDITDSLMRLWYERTKGKPKARVNLKSVKKRGKTKAATTPAPEPEAKTGT